jgi:hypothetical protein
MNLSGTNVDFLGTGNPRMDATGGVITAKDAALEMMDAIGRSQFYIWRRLHNDEICFNWREGMSDDGRYHRKDLNREPFPFENAPDNRILLSDGIINSNVRKIKKAFLDGDFPQPVGMKDADWAMQLQQLCHNMTHSRMMPDIVAQVETFAGFEERLGTAAMAITWDEQMGLIEKTVTVQDYFQALADAGQAQDLDNEDLFIALYPGVSNKVAVKALKDLRETGEAVFNAPYVTTAKAKCEAMEIMSDLVLPANTRDPQQARWLSRRILYTESELRAQAAVQGWSDEWVDKCLQQIGVSVFVDWQNSMGRNPEGVMGIEGPMQIAYQMIEIWCVYCKRAGKDGERGVYYNVIHPAVTELQAWKKDRLLPYQHGQYPFIFGQREKISKLWLESRGVPEILRTQQDAIKIQRDTQGARALIEAFPPMEAKIGNDKMRWKNAPSAQNFTRTGSEYRYVETQRGTESAQIALKDARQEANWYCGQPDPEIPPDVAQEYAQNLVDHYMSEIGQMEFMILQLMAQYMDKADAEEVVGPLLKDWPEDAAEIRTPHFFTPQFDLRRTNLEYVTNMVDAVSKIMPLDNGGAIDGSGIAGWLTNLLDPGMKRFVRTGGSATQKEIDDQQTRIAKIAMGMQPPIPESGVNPQLRLQTISSTLQGSPQLQAAFANPKAPQTLTLLKDVQHYQFMLAQQQNKVVGRLGVQPAPQQPQTAQVA